MFQINVTELKSQLAEGRKVGYLQRASEDFKIVTSALPHLRPKPLGQAACIVKCGYSSKGGYLQGLEMPGVLECLF